MELRIWVDRSDLPSNVIGGEDIDKLEEEVLRDILSVMEEWYASNYGGILESELVED